MLMKRQVSELTTSCKESGSASAEKITMGNTHERAKESIDSSCSFDPPASECCLPSSQDSEGSTYPSNEQSGGSSQDPFCNTSVARQSNKLKKKARKSQCSQLTLKSFFQKMTNINNGVKDPCIDNLNKLAELTKTDNHLKEAPESVDQCNSPKPLELDTDNCDQKLAELDDSSTRKERSNVALLEWQRIQQRKQNSIPLCKGHKEPCVARVVKKQGPNFGRRFYTCARAEVIYFC